jgi:5,10-methylenetetrahydromethanopterin reductase
MSRVNLKWPGALAPGHLHLRLVSGRYGRPMGLDLSCAFATSLATPAHVALAEQLGYRRAWLYDSPALYPDVWMTLAECAAVTERIGLGPGVLIPALRHPLVTASAIAHLVSRAPGRVMVGVGSGFTGRVAMGKRPMAWAKVAEYVTVVGELLAGRTTEWDGAAIRMLHAHGFTPSRPIDVPFVLGVSGPLGQETARKLGIGRPPGTPLPSGYTARPNELRRVTYRPT